MFGITLLVKKHSVKFHSRQIDPVHSPLMHNCKEQNYQYIYYHKRERDRKLRDDPSNDSTKKKVFLLHLSSLVTSSLIGSWQRRRALWGSPVTRWIVTTIGFSLALNVFGEGNELAGFARTTRPLAGTVEEKWHVRFTDQMSPMLTCIDPYLHWVPDFLVQPLAVSFFILSKSDICLG